MHAGRGAAAVRRRAHRNPPAGARPSGASGGPRTAARCRCVAWPARWRLAAGTSARGGLCRDTGLVVPQHERLASGRDPDTPATAIPVDTSTARVVGTRHRCARSANAIAVSTKPAGKRRQEEPRVPPRVERDGTTRAPAPRTKAARATRAAVDDGEDWRDGERARRPRERHEERHQPGESGRVDRDQLCGVDPRTPPERGRDPRSLMDTNAAPSGSSADRAVRRQRFDFSSTATRGESNVGARFASRHRTIVD
jgi:hypothetical protein